VSEIFVYDHPCMIESRITVEWSWLVVIFWYLVYTASVVISTGQWGWALLSGLGSIV